MRYITVRTRDGDYDIVLGKNSLNEIDLEQLSEQFDAVGCIISDRVLTLHEESVKKTAARLGGRIYSMTDSEENKNYQHAERYFNLLLKEGFTRKSLLVGIGGGVVGDFSGFCAATFMRGISIIHIPTTLLAMVDSSIGGKVAVNIQAGKNIVGVFHQPRIVIADMRFLHSLPDREIQNGIAETIKHALIGELRLIPILNRNTLTSIRKDDVMEELIFLSASFKAAVVGQDVREAEIRAILNYGHTVGHALESWMQYKEISHGEAVAWGMKAEAEISRRMGLLNDGDATFVNELLECYDFASKPPAFDPSGVLEHMKFDKKNIKNSLRFVLLKKIGEPVYNIEVEASLVLDVLKNLIK